MKKGANMKNKNNSEKNKEQKKAWRDANPRYNKLYYKKNIDKIKERCKTQSRAWKEANQEKVKSYNKLRNAQKNAEAKHFIENIKVHYGCCNPACKWDGEYLPCLLDFHHIVVDAKKCGVGILRYLGKLSTLK